MINIIKMGRQRWDINQSQCVSCYDTVHVLLIDLPNNQSVTIPSAIHQYEIKYIV